MKNKIVFLTLIILIILVICLSVFGFKLGNFKILSVSDLINRNNEVETKIEQATTLTSSTYPTVEKNLQGTIDAFQIQKEKYEQMVGFVSEDENNAYETEKYDIGYLWTILGKYATKNKLSLALDIKKGVGIDLYDLDFTVQGEYVNISEFITKIENDSNLLFRIYNFKLVPGKSNIDLKATFTVKDVNIDNATLSKNLNLTTTEQTTNQNNQTDNSSSNTEE